MTTIPIEHIALFQGLGQASLGTLNYPETDRHIIGVYGLIVRDNYIVTITYFAPGPLSKVRNMGRAGRCSNRRELKPDPGAQSYSFGESNRPWRLTSSTQCPGIQGKKRRYRSNRAAFRNLGWPRQLHSYSRRCSLGSWEKRPRTCTVRSPGSMENTEVLFDLSLPRHAINLAHVIPNQGGDELGTPCYPKCCRLFGVEASHRCHLKVTARGAFQGLVSRLTGPT